ncbi:sulfate ABC transporter substrate-binding protein [Nonomuraea sp. CA-141351]|uniref:sulfate ABC transporter substrate-binding protein n=1 Tax=Nonomuraea sp. CA-141351 TaxID=3239996 RepID=UPI003D920D17
MNVRRHLATATVVASIATLAACGGGGSDSGSGGQVQLSLVAYSTPQAAYEKIIKAFQATPEGKNVTFTKSFGASGDQSRAVEAGLKADIVAFSLEPDMTRLVKKGLVAEDWSAGDNKGMITDSVVVIATRKGNPKSLKTWDDLTKPGVEVITPNPFTSGGARWNVMAGYGAKSNKGADKQTGVNYLNALFANVPVQDDSARKSLQTFSSGKGDAILAYENEAIFAQQNNQPLDYTVPDSTILIENPVAVTKNSAHPNEAKAFLKFLYTTEAQKIFADNGYRPVVKGVQGVSFPAPPALFTIADLGGWPKVTTEFFDPKGSVMADIERKLGVSTEK